MSIWLWLSIAFGVYVLAGLAVIAYFEVRGWPDGIPGFPAKTLLVVVAFLPSYLLWQLGVWLYAVCALWLFWEKGLCNGNRPRARVATETGGLQRKR